MAQVYISANDATKAELLAGVLMDRYHNVVSSWHGANGSVSGPDPENRNYPEIESADTLVVIADNYPVPGGKHVEAGYALGRGKRVVVFGRDYDNRMYANDARVALVKDVETLLDLLRAGS